MEGKNGAWKKRFFRAWILQVHTSPLKTVTGPHMHVQECLLKHCLYTSKTVGMTSDGCLDCSTATQRKEALTFTSTGSYDTPVRERYTRTQSAVSRAKRKNKNHVHFVGKYMRIKAWKKICVNVTLGWDCGMRGQRGSCSSTLYTSVLFGTWHQELCKFL